MGLTLDRILNVAIMIWESLLRRASMHSKSFPIKISEFSREIRIVQFRKFLNIKMIIEVYLGQNGLIIFIMIPSSKSQYSNIFQLACLMFTPDTLMDATTIMSNSCYSSETVYSVTLKTNRHVYTCFVLDSFHQCFLN